MGKYKNIWNYISWRIQKTNTLKQTFIQ
jgi:hypothetical protein